MKLSAGKVPDLSRPGGNDENRAVPAPKHLGSRWGDWRFLLYRPPSGRALLLGGRQPGAIPVRAEGCDHLTKAELERRGSATDGAAYGLVAATHPASMSIARGPVWESMTPSDLTGYMTADAQLYAEIDRPAATFPPQFVRMSLRKAGLRDVGFYWPRPGFSAPEMFMPLGDRRLQRYYLRTLFLGSSLPKKALRTALRLLVELRLFELALPGYVAIAGREQASGRSLPYILSGLLDHWAEVDIRRVRPQRAQWLLLDAGLSEQSKLVCPCWLDGETLPSLVLKFPRDPRYNNRVQAEYSALSEAQRFLPRSQRQIPRPCASLIMGQTRVTVETAVRGRPLSAYMQEHPNTHATTLSRWKPFLGWLIDFHATSARPASTGEMVAALFAPLEAASRDLQLSTVESASLSQLADVAARLAGKSPLPLVFNHNDLGPPNVLCTSSGRFQAVIDWEAAGFGLPATDVIYFLGRFSYMARSEGKRDPLRGFREMFYNQGSAQRIDNVRLEPSVARAWLSLYCHRLGVSTDWLPVLFGVCWIMHARNEAARMEANDRSPESPQPEGHFRAHLRFYLEHLNELTITPNRPPKPASRPG